MLLTVARSALHYRSRLMERDAPIVSSMKELSAQYPRYGYRRIHVFLERDGFRMSTDKAYRLWKLSGLQVPRKRPRRRPSASRPRPQAPTMANQVWAPGGHLKLPHPWPGQIPPSEAAGRVDGYTRSSRFATRAAASRSRQLLPSNFSRCAWCISRSSSGVTMTTSPSSVAQSSTGRLDVMIVERFS